MTGSESNRESADPGSLDQYQGIRQVRAGSVVAKHSLAEQRVWSW